MLTMISHAQYVIHWKNKAQVVYIVKLDHSCCDFDWLIGQTVEIDGKVCIILGVERFTHQAPWLPGESIGLVVDETHNTIKSD